MTDADDIPENAADTLSGDVANQDETSLETTLDSNSYDETPADAGLEAPKKPFQPLWLAVPLAAALLNISCQILRLPKPPHKA